MICTMRLAVTEIEFIPIWFAQVWRVLVWCADLSLLTTLAFYVPRLWRTRHDGAAPNQEWVAWVMLGVMIVLARDAVVQAEYWDNPLYLEGLPVTTVVVAVWIRARHLRTGHWV